MGRNCRGWRGQAEGSGASQLPHHTPCLGAAPHSYCPWGQPVALLGCTEADMDFWCWRGRAAETLARKQKPWRPGPWHG